MIILILSATLALASTPAVVGDGTVPVKTAAQIAEEKRLATCEADLEQAREDLSDCGNRLEAKAKATAPAKAKTTTTTTTATQQVMRTTVNPVAPAPAPAPAPVTVTVTPIVPPVAPPNNYVLAPNPGPMVTQVAVDYPKRERQEREPKEPRAPKVADTNPSSASAGDARFKVLVGGTGGVGWGGSDIKDKAEVAVGGGIEIPVNARFGFLQQRDGGLVVGVLGHAAVETTWGGTDVGGGVAILHNTKFGNYGAEIGGGYTGYSSIDSQANAWMWGGEANLIADIPLGKQTSHVNMDLFVAAGSKIGVLYNEDKGDTTWGADPNANVGFVFTFGAED